MNQDCKLSDVAKTYLEKFYCILDDMILGMTGAELTNSISHNFIVQMIPHHQAAIEMSQNILQYTTCVPLQKIAQGIIAEQTKSIENMRRILCLCGKLANCPRDVNLYQRKVTQIMQTMFSEMGKACADNNVSADFMREMIPHHKGAIRMSKNALQFEICPELKPILTAIITSQEKGVAQMEWLLCTNRC